MSLLQVLILNTYHVLLSWLHTPCTSSQILSTDSASYFVNL